MSEELMITQQDLIDWIDRPPSNDDLDLALFISTRLEQFYELEQKLQQKENIIKEVRYYVVTHKLYNYVYDEEELFEITSDKKAKDELLEILDKGE